MKKILILALRLILQMRPTSFKSESGAILPIVIILMLALTITGLAFLTVQITENRLVWRQIHKEHAFWLAETGLERTLWNLKQDFMNDGEDWAKEDEEGWIRINGVRVEEKNGNILLYDLRVC